MNLPDNVESYIAPIKKSEIPVSDSLVANQVNEGEIGYTAGGYASDTCQECEVSDPLCYAKVVNFTSNKGDLITKYYVKIGIRGFMYDPWSPYTEGSENVFARTHGRSAWIFREVSKRSFEFYKEFLKSRNRAWKINAERELINA